MDISQQIINSKVLSRVLLKIFRTDEAKKKSTVKNVKKVSSKLFTGQLFRENYKNVLSLESIGEKMQHFQ